MKAFVTLALFIFFWSVNGFAHGKKNQKPITVTAPPAQLNKYYPPESTKFEWVGVMHRISGGFKGAWIDAKQGDWDNSLKNAEALLEGYKKAYDMSGPEWQEKYFKLDTAEAFVKAVRERSMKEMGPISKKLGETCSTCHYEQYSSVWLRYYWSNVDTISLEDPITEKKMDFEEYKHALVSSFYLFLNEGKQGEKSIALKALKEFIARYRGVKAACMKCHEDEKVKYFFIGGKVGDALGRLSEISKSSTFDFGAAMSEIGFIGKEGCKKCHLTHRMAAILKKGQRVEHGK